MTLIELNRIDLSAYCEYLKETNDFLGEAGKEHYRLLNYLCNGKGLVFDIGTYKGHSSIAMSSAKKVISYDVQRLRTVKKKKNVTYKIGNAIKDKDLLKADVILLDTYHDGKFEHELYNALKKGFKGVLVVDDIHLNKEMKGFWASIIHPKKDVTNIGHYSGTGIVYFDGTKVNRCSSCG